MVICRGKGSSLILEQVKTCSKMRLDPFSFFPITNPVAMRKLGGVIADASEPSSVIYLQGDLGAGKTTLVRGFLRSLGYLGHVRSPTFNLFEVYQIKTKVICHFDLYRLTNPEELIYIGISDYFTEKNICLIEWPEHGKGFLQPADLVCKFNFIPGKRGRDVEIIATSSKGRRMLKKIIQKKDV